MTKLKKIRCKRKMRQRELAFILGVKPASVCELEKNGIRSVRTAKRYAAALLCEPQMLLEIN
ncbi:MAG: helix-turn-helix transcriptional regulator [Victivallales bacterium]|nr:helix-turn-helix transcriptional regulator [Victivallales bacterium]